MARLADARTHHGPSANAPENPARFCAVGITTSTQDMQATLETLEGLERKLKIVVPAERLEQGVEEKLREAASQARLNGFRPGKVPMREIRRRFGEGIRQEVGGELMNESFLAAVQENAVEPAGSPSIGDVTLAAGADLEFTASFEVFPELNPAGFEAIRIERPSAAVEESDIEQMIQSLREQRTVYEPVERAAEAGDKLNIDFRGLIDGEAFEGGSAEGADIEIGSGSMIPGFEDGLIGQSAGATPSLNLTFPDTYHVDDLQGKAVTFEITVNAVTAPELPELTDEFFTEFGVSEGGEAAFREEVRGNMGKELEGAIRNRVKQQVMDGLEETNEVDVPRALINSEIDHMRADMAQRFGGNQQIDPSVLPAEMFEPQAKKRVTLGLIVKAIVEKAELSVDDEAVREHVEEMASSYENPEAIVNFYYQNSEQMSQIENMVLEQQVVDHVLAAATVEDVSMSYTEATKPPPPPEPETDSAADADAGADDAEAEAAGESDDASPADKAD